jgi:hypothetical protein
MAYGQPSFRREDWRTAEKRWRELSGRERREAIRLSRKDRIHPDPRVAEIAYRWAVMKVYVGERNVVAKPIVAIPVALITLPLGGGTGGALINYWRTVRAARRIVAATENPTGGKVRNPS